MPAARTARGNPTTTWTLLAALLLSTGTLAGPLDEDPEVVFDLTVLEADWLSRKDARGEVERVLDTWTDVRDLQHAIRSGAFLARASSLRVGRTRTLAEAELAFPLGEPVVVETEEQKRGKPVAIVELTPDHDPHHPGSYRVALALKSIEGAHAHRELSFRPHRPRLWLLPTEHVLQAVLLVARPLRGPAAAATPGHALFEDLDVDIAVYRAPWLHGVRPERMDERDFRTWVDPFDDPNPHDDRLLKPLLVAEAGTAELLYRERGRAKLGELIRFGQGRRPAQTQPRAVRGKAAGPLVGVSFTAREHEDGAHRFAVTLGLESSHLQDRGLVLLRNFELDSGDIQAWLTPTEDHLHVVLCRLSRRLPGFE
ncbi:MAG: hypothetical protein AAF533_01290 [Acidobacteriota bacterium]